MQTLFKSPIQELVRKRTSVRTYNNTEVSAEVKAQIKAYMEELTNPFSAKVNFKLLQSNTAINAAKLGTYGVIKGATEYIGSTVQDSEFALEALGYEFEKLILFATDLNLGTCWLGGTFKRGEFAKAMSVEEGELFPAIIPFGYAAEKKSITDTVMRFLSKGDTRKPWSDLFFNKDFSTPLSQHDAGAYASSLEMLRLAPSASNKQPWRVVKDGNIFHFYESKAPGYSTSFGYDIQRIDMGIVACHFHLTALENNLQGEFQKLDVSGVAAPKETFYKFSWVAAE